MDVEKTRTIKKEMQPAFNSGCRPSGAGMPEYAVTRLKEAYEDDDTRGMGYRKINDKNV